MNRVRAMTGDQKHKTIFKRLTLKQWSVYYYLLSICHWNGKDREDHYFVYKNQINVSAAAKQIKISRPTFYTALDNLKKQYIVVEYDDYYTIQIPSIFASIDQATLSYLLPYQKTLGPDLIRVYALLCRMDEHPELDRHFNKKMLLNVLGHNVKDNSFYEQMEIILAFLRHTGLIDVKIKTINSQIGHYIDYLLIKTCIINDKNVMIDTDLESENVELTNKLKEIIEAEKLWGIKT